MRSKNLLLTCASCFSALATGYFTYKATRMADLKLEEEGALRDDWKYRFKRTWAFYIPALLGGGVTIASLIMNQDSNNKVINAIGGSAALSSDMLRKYEDKTRELFGENGLRDIQRSIAEDEARGIVRAKIQSISASDMFVSICDKAEEGDRLFLDIYTNCWFRTSKEAVRIAEYHLNRNFILGAGACLEDFYDFLGIELTKKQREQYKYLGWGENFIDDGFYWIDFSHQDAVTDDGEEYTILAYSVAPESLMVEEV